MKDFFQEFLSRSVLVRGRTKPIVIIYGYERTNMTVFCARLLTLYPHPRKMKEKYTGWNELNLVVEQKY